METETREESEATAATRKYGRFDNATVSRDAPLKSIPTNRIQCHDLINVVFIQILGSLPTTSIQWRQNGTHSVP